MANLEIRLLGPFQVSLVGRTNVTFESSKVRALLAILAAEPGRPHQRDALTGLLWPDWPQKAALRNLVYALANLRKNIGDRQADPPFLLTSREAIQLNPSANVWVDVTEFEQLAAVSLELHLQTPATALYRGNFLEGFSLGDSPAFEEWILSKREYYRQMALRAFYDQAEVHEGRGEYEQAFSYAGRQLELEPWQEQAHRQLMRLLALTGQRNAALAQYETCQRLLLKELGVKPSAETTRLYEDIRDGNLKWVTDRQAAAAASPGELPPEPGEPPFKGLQYFDVADADLFFGREALVERLVGHIREMVAVGAGLIPSAKHSDRGATDPPLQFLAVVGASGSGKSSVMRAGVVPALRRNVRSADEGLPPEGSQSWLIHVFTPTVHPLEALAISLTREVESVTAAMTLIDDMARDSRSLHLYCQRLASPIPSPLSPQGIGGKHLLLIVDQFEELFTLCRGEEERTAFLDNLLGAVLEGGPTQVIVVLRADFYAHCARYPQLRQALSARQEFIGPMEATELRQAIEQPALRNGWEFETGLVDLILRDVGEEPGALPLLEHALLETWKRRSGRTLTLKGYAESGGVHGAVAKTAENVFARLNPEQQGLARHIFLRLTELGEGTQDTRRRAALAELVPGDAVPTMVEGLLKTLADARLITLAEDTAEVAHEALIRKWDRLRLWLSEDRESLRLHRHLTQAAETWVEMNRDLGELLHGARLAQAVEWTKNHVGDLNALEREFLQASQEQARREVAEREAQRQRELQAARHLTRTQRQRSLAILAVLTLVVILIGAGLLVLRSLLINAAFVRAERERANQARIGLSRQLAQQSLAQPEDRLDLALLLALEAEYTADTADAQSSLLSALQSSSRQLQTILNSDTNTTSLVFSPDGKLMASAGGDTKILLWDVTNPIAPTQFGQPLAENFGKVVQILFSPNSKLLASGSWDGMRRESTVLLWNVSHPGFPVLLARPMSVNANEVTSLAFSPDGKILAVGSGNDADHTGAIFLWDISDPATPVVLGKPFTLYEIGVSSLIFSPDDKRLASGNYDGSIVLWDMTNPSAPVPLGQPLTGHPYAVNHLAFSPDGRQLASGSWDGNILLWDISDPAAPVLLSKPFQGNTGHVTSLAFSHDGKMLASGSFDHPILLWDISNPEAPFERDHLFVGSNRSVDSLAFSPDGKTLASGSCPDKVHSSDCRGQIFLWDTSDLTAPVLLDRQLRGHNANVSSLAFSPDGKWLATGSYDKTVILWDVSDPAGLASYSLSHNGHSGEVSSLAFSPDGKTLASGSWDQTIILWNVSDPAAPSRLGQPLAGHTNTVSKVAFSPDGRTLASGSSDHTIILWDVSNPAAPSWLGQPLSGHDWTISSLAFSPDGKILASGSNNSTLFLWDVSNPAAPVRLGNLFSRFVRPVNSLAFSPDGQILAVGSIDYLNNLGSIFLWNVSYPAAPVPLGNPLTGHNNEVTSVAFSPDGKRLASGSNDNSVIIWDISNPVAPVQIGHPFTGRAGLGISVAFSPDGRWLASDIFDKTVSLWDVSIESWKDLACRLAGRNLTQTEWRLYLPYDPYRKTCPQWKADQ